MIHVIATIRVAAPASAMPPDAATESTTASDGLTRRLAIISRASSKHPAASPPGESTS